eukprot:351955-Chlamydomonas_euryale.AAC.17
MTPGKLCSAVCTVDAEDEGRRAAGRGVKGRRDRRGRTKGPMPSCGNGEGVDHPPTFGVGCCGGEGRPHPRRLRPAVAGRRSRCLGCALIAPPPSAAWCESTEVVEDVPQEMKWNAAGVYEGGPWEGHWRHGEGVPAQPCRLYEYERHDLVQVQGTSGRGHRGLYRGRSEFRGPPVLCRFQ